MTREIFMSRLNVLRGLFAIQIILGHVVQYENSLINLWGRLMIVSVSYFFFVSAMGLAKSFESKQNYLNHFIKNKIIYLLIISLIAYLFACLLELTTPIGLLYIQPQINILYTFYTTTNWYVFELLFFYFIFFMTYKYVKKPINRLAIITAFTIIIMILSYIYLYEAYYASSLAFPFGLAFYTYYDKFNSFLHTVWGYFSTVILILLGTCCFIIPESFLTMVCLRNAMCIGCLLLFFYFVSKYDLTCSITKYLTSYSTELYFLQFRLIIFINTLPYPWILRCIITVPIVLIAALIVAPLRKTLSSKVFS